MKDILVERAKAVKAVRRWFEERNFLEVETPVLVPYENPDDNVENVKAAFKDFSGKSYNWFLHTSPEFFMKRLVWHGAERIFQVCKVFRDGEITPLHSVEFTMVEWYRVNGTYADGVEETLGLIEAVGKALREDFKLGAATFLTVEEAFSEFAGVNPFNREALKEAAGEKDYRTAFFKLLVDKVEPALSKFPGPVVLHLYPEAFSAVAKVVNGKAQRFELYLKGVELANGYTELTSYEDYEKVFSKKERSYDFGLLNLLKERPLPPCEGVALGLDRLLALLTGRKSVKEVIPFSTQELIEEVRENLPNP